MTWYVPLCRRHWAWRLKLTTAMILLAILLLAVVSVRTPMTQAGRVVAGFDCATLTPLGWSVSDAKMTRCSYRVRPVHYSPGQQVRGTTTVSYLTSRTLPILSVSGSESMYIETKPVALSKKRFTQWCNIFWISRSNSNSFNTEKIYFVSTANL